MQDEPRQLSAAGLVGPHALRNYYLTRTLLGFVLPGALVGLIAASKAGLVILPDGLAQKFGAVQCHLKITHDPCAKHGDMVEPRRQ